MGMRRRSTLMSKRKKVCLAEQERKGRETHLASQLLSLFLPIVVVEVGVGRAQPQDPEGFDLDDSRSLLDVVW